MSREMEFCTMGLRSIPPITSTGSNRGIKNSWGFGRTTDGQTIVRRQLSNSHDSCNYKIEPLRKPPAAKSCFSKTCENRKIDLELFEEGDDLKIIGEFPGPITKKDIDIQIEKDTLHIANKPSGKRTYKVNTKLPIEFDSIKQVEVRNNIVTITLERGISGLERTFQKCMEKFPELKNMHLKLKVEKTSDKLSGAIGTVNGEKAVMLQIPNKMWGCWEDIKPLIYHELSHCIDLHNPDKVFFKRADEKSIKLWKILQEAETVACEVVNVERIDMVGRDSIIPLKSTNKLKNTNDTNVSAKINEIKVK